MLAIGFGCRNGHRSRVGVGNRLAVANAADVGWVQATVFNHGGGLGRYNRCMREWRFWLLVVGVGVLLGGLLIAMQVARYSFVLGDWTLEVYLLAAGAPLLAAGVWVGRWWNRGEPADPPVSPPDSPLTPRELEILAHVSTGLSNQEIADRLFVSLPTVKSHLQSIYGKLDVGRRTQAVDRARKLGLVS